MGPKKSDKSDNKAERPTWKEEEVKALLAIWANAAIQSQLDGTTRNNKVFARIADDLAAQGIEDKTASQCRNKLKNLKRDYKKVKDYNRNQSGGKRKTCPYFDTLDSVLGCRPTIEPGELLCDTALPAPAAPAAAMMVEPIEAEDDRESAGSATVSDMSLVDEDIESQDESLDDSSSSHLDVSATTITSEQNPGTSRKTADQDDSGPPSKKRKVKPSRMEEAFSSALHSFNSQQDATMKNLLLWEEKQAEKERDREDRRRQEDRHHEMQLFRMMGQMMAQFGRGQNQPQHDGSIHFEDDGTSFMRL